MPKSGWVYKTDHVERNIEQSQNNEEIGFYSKVPPAPEKKADLELHCVPQS